MKDKIKDYVFYLLAITSCFWAIFITLIALGSVIEIFEASLVIGLVLFFIFPIGIPLYMAPVIVAWGGIYWLRGYLQERTDSIWGYWIRQIGGYICCIVLPVIIWFVVHSFFGFLLWLFL